MGSDPQFAATPAAPAARRRPSQAPPLAVSFRQPHAKTGPPPRVRCPHAPAASLPLCAESAYPTSPLRFLCLLSSHAVDPNRARVCDPGAKDATCRGTTAHSTAIRLESPLVSPSAIPSIAPDRAEEGPVVPLHTSTTGPPACPRPLPLVPVSLFVPVSLSPSSPFCSTCPSISALWRCLKPRTGSPGPRRIPAISRLFRPLHVPCFA